MKQNILIIKLSAIGDVLMATPAFKTIRAKYPGSRIHLLVGKWAGEVVKGNPNIDELIIIDENIFWKKKVFSIIKLISRLRKTKFDVIYNMQWSNMFNLFALLAGGKERIGFDRFGNAKFLTKKVPFKEGEKGVHATEQYLSLVTSEKIADKSMNIYLAEDEVNKAKDEINRLNLDKEWIVGIAPGGGSNPKSSMPTRRWLFENFKQLVEVLVKDSRCHICLFGSSDETILGDNLAVIDRKLVHNYMGKLTLRETAALMKYCKVVVVNDSGLMHLAAAVGTPTISIFGPTAPWDKIPFGNKHYCFYANESCSPCYKYGKFPDCKNQMCFKNITTQDVYNKVIEVVGIQGV